MAFPSSSSCPLLFFLLADLLWVVSWLRRNRCTKMALVHDLAEAITGDVVPEDGVPKDEKHDREWDAMSRPKDLLKGNPFGAWTASVS